jgi:oligopeptide/dipeptide ABC transporter ATP-binding protein
MAAQHAHTLNHDVDEDVVLEVRDAAVTFDMERGESRVLDDVNLSVQRGEILGVVGESGSGKSMLASAMLNAVVSPGQLSGEVIYNPPDDDPVDLTELDAEDLRSLRWEDVSFVIQAAQSAFNPTTTIGDHFVETLRHHDVAVEDGMDRGRELLSDLYLNPEQMFSSYPHELSGGQKQRALIALSLVLDPELLVLDEPTSALDLLMQRSIISLLANIKRKYDLTLVFVTHDMPVVADIATRIAVMYSFEVVELAETDDIMSGATHPYTRALLNSVPKITTPADDVSAIPGSSPDPINVPEGCSYHPRCPLADEDCRTADPALRDVDGGHEVACFHWEEAPEAVPFSFEEGENA